MTEDARRHPRFAVAIEAVVTTAKGETMEATTKDMSHGGICLVCPKEVGAGEALELGLSLVLGADTFTESLTLPSRVVWCTPLPGKGFQVGAMFHKLDRAKRGFLEMFLRFLQQEVLLADGEPPLEESVPNKEFDTGDADKP
jgi:hypothetical protein